MVKTHLPVTSVRTFQSFIPFMVEKIVSRSLWTFPRKILRALHVLHGATPFYIVTNRPLESGAVQLAAARSRLSQTLAAPFMRVST